MTTTTTAQGYDAGELRERIVRDLASWKAAGFASHATIKAIRLRTNLLARKLNRSRRRVAAELDAEAQTLADAGE